MESTACQAISKKQQTAAPTRAVPHANAVQGFSVTSQKKPPQTFPLRSILKPVTQTNTPEGSTCEEHSQTFSWIDITFGPPCDFHSHITSSGEIIIICGVAVCCVSSSTIIPVGYGRDTRASVVPGRHGTRMIVGGSPLPGRRMRYPFSSPFPCSVIACCIFLSTSPRPETAETRMPGVVPGGNGARVYVGRNDIPTRNIPVAAETRMAPSCSWGEGCQG